MSCHHLCVSHPTISFSLLLLLLSVVSASPTTLPPTLESRPRPPPRVPQHPLTSSTLFTDQSDYLSLGDHVGTVLAIGDFTNDRYPDLVVVDDARSLRSVHVLVWNHHSFSFRRARAPHHSSFSTSFSLGHVPGLASDAVIASVATFDANSDGLLDALVSVRLSDSQHLGIVLLGDGSGCLRFDQILPDIHPGLLIMDANDDMLHDIFVTTPGGDRIFLLNGPPGVFSKKVWNPWGTRLECAPTYPFNSNAFVDVDGDCQPDLVVTSACGMEVWLNAEARNTRASAWVNVQTFPKDRHNFTNMTYAKHHHRAQILPRSVWAPDGGDGRATFADFNGDGSIDIAVPNGSSGTLRISYLHRRARLGRRLCAADVKWRFSTRIVLNNIDISNSNLGPTRVQSKVHVGDFNFDGLADILLLDGESGTLRLYIGELATQKQAWFSGASSTFGRIVFAVTGHAGRNTSAVQYLRYALFTETPILHHIEDPLAATFFDVDESGRQDILIAQQHGTRLIWNNYKKMEDAVFFKATGVNAARRASQIPGDVSGHAPVASRYVSANGTRFRNPKKHLEGERDGSTKLPEDSRALSPPPGLTFKISYGGRSGRETHICTQCPQTGVLSLQACSCMFGITNIANYIEEMAMGGVGGVRTSTGLMPNALAIVWPEREASGAGLRWRVSYLSKGRDGQVRRIIIALFATLVILLFAILFIHGLESESRGDKFTVGYT